MDKQLDKFQRRAIAAQQKRIKPGECMNYVRLVIDNEICNNDAYAPELLTQLRKCQLKYVVRSLPHKHCIMWERSVGQRTLKADAEQPLDDEWQAENQVVYLLRTHELQGLDRSWELEALGAQLRTALPMGRNCTIFALHSPNKPTVKQVNTMTAVILELQVLQKLNVLVMGNIEELVAQLFRFTKSIAEAPYKQQKAANLKGFKQYVLNDNKQCVRVVGTHGFGRLWQQHLNRLPLVTLDVAEAIIAQYSCPRKLLDEFEQNPHAINAIADLRVTRGAIEPFQNSRRIGNVLATKLHTLYHARDGDALL